MTYDLTLVHRHLEAQLRSVRSMLGFLDEQETAVRAQDIPAVMAATSKLQGEMVRRERLEADRDALLGQVAAVLGCSTQDVTAADLAGLDPSGLGEQVRALSEQLRHAITELQRRHGFVQELLKTELAFVAHLVAAMNPAASGKGVGYDNTGSAPAASTARPSSLDLRG